MSSSCLNKPLTPSLFGFEETKQNHFKMQSMARQKCPMWSGLYDQTMASDRKDRTPLGHQKVDAVHPCHLATPHYPVQDPSHIVKGE